MFNFSPKIIKILKVIGTIILFCTLIPLFVWLFNYIRTKLNTRDENSELSDGKADDIKLTAQGMKQTYPDSWYADQANQFFEKFDKPIGSGGVNDIMPYLKRLGNYIDFLKFKGAFGIRDVSFTTNDMNLSEFVSKKFDSLAQSSYNGYVRGLLEYAKRHGYKF